MILYLVILAIAAAYYLLKRNNDYWEKRGVPGPKPSLFFGNLKDSFFLKKTPSLIYIDIYRQYPNEPIIGVYRSLAPTLIIKDPELIKDVTIKSFNHFHDNEFFVDQKVDPIFGKNPFVLRGDDWKMVRTQLTPGFTSGKMKWIYPHLEENSKNMIAFIQKQALKEGQGYEAKELCYRLTLNNVATCAFGLDGKCFEEENSEFRAIAHEFLQPRSWTFTMFFVLSLMPSLSKIFSLRVVPKNVEERLFNIVSQTLKYRTENKVVRNDFLHIMNQLRETCKDYEFTDIDVTAHASGFFVDGSETSSLIMSFLLYELAMNQEVQDKLREEVVKTFQENNNQLPYEAVSNMAYLDAVFYENLRKHPAGVSLLKVCTKDYTCEQDNKKLIIEKGTSIVIPTYGLHYDPKYFENPETFNPDRFLGENKEKIKKCTFMPFGEGPRSCLGQRFGRLQIKVGVAYLIKNYILTLNERTKNPLEIDTMSVFLTPIGGLWLNFKKIP